MDAKAKKRQRERNEKIKKNEAKKREVVRDAILKYDAPELHTECSVVSQLEDLSFVDKMKKVLSFTKDGVGLSANQIGITKKVFVIRPRIKTNEMKVFINPEIVEMGSVIARMTEGCLSCPGIFIDIDRPTKVKLKYYDEKFVEKTEEFENFVSRIILHEVEHGLSEGCQIGKEWKKRNK
jgi:peptide deformylase